MSAVHAAAVEAHHAAIVASAAAATARHDATVILVVTIAVVALLAGLLILTASVRPSSRRTQDTPVLTPLSTLPVDGECPDRADARRASVRRAIARAILLNQARGLAGI